MTVELGHFCLILALLTALAAIAAPKAAKNASAVLFALLSLSFLALIYAYVTSDFSVLNVVENSHTMKPLLYKISGVWGNHEGSMLLWVWMLSFWGLLLSRSSLPEKFLQKVLAVQASVAAGFLAFILFTSNPFARLSPPALEGMDLNPLLQDPALALHPPMLYAGYVGFSVAFSFAIAALLEKEIRADFAAALRPWVLAAWAFLTCGIGLGSYWAYYELGWGGFWFWDPVENASLMPWFAGAALFHSLLVLEKRKVFPGWVIFLALFSFTLSLVGTFIVRSGVLTSVHAFASDPARGVFILALLSVFSGGAFLLYALRMPEMKSGAPFRVLSRETALLLNNVFLFTFTATVFIGTLYPVFLSALGLGSVAVGPPYYKAVLVPMIFPFALLMGVVSYVPWRGGNGGSLKKMAAPVLVSLAFLMLPVPPLAIAGFAAAGWIICASLYDVYLKRRQKHPASYPGMMTAHLGFALLLAGITGATQLSSENILWMQPGDHVKVARADIVFLGTDTGLGKNYNSEQGAFLADGKLMVAERRWYPADQKETTESALSLSHGGVLYIVIGDRDEKKWSRRVVRVYHHPLLPLAYGGGLLMALGAVASILRRKRA